MKLTPLQPWIETKIGYPVGTLTQEALEEYQLRRIRATLAHVKGKSIFYQRKLRNTPAEISSLEEFRQVPFTNADDLRHGGLQMVCVSQGDINRVVTLDTSGTSGTPKRLYFTREDQELTVDFFGVGMSSLVDPGDRVLILLPGETPGSVGDLLRLGLERMGIVALKHGPVKDPAETLARIRGENINCLVGVPAHFLGLLRREQENITEPPLKLKSVLLSTDYVPAAITRQLKAVWDCEVFNHYGMTEMGLGGGVSCGAQRGYHLREADLYFEIVDPGSGEPTLEGETGEVVFTTLTRMGMPLVRYRTGDLSRFIPGECPCGTQLKTMEFISQRVEGFVMVGGQPLTIPELDEALFSLPELINYSAAVTHHGDKDLLEMDVFMNKLSARSEIEVRDAINSISAIRLAAEAGTLTIDCALKEGYPAWSGSMLKRKILIKFP